MNPFIDHTAIAYREDKYGGIILMMPPSSSLLAAFEKNWPKSLLTIQIKN